jgi:uncharacterized membrane protein
MDDRPIDVSVLMLGIDADKRAEVQSAMRKIAERGDSSRPDGLVKMLGEAIVVLKSARGSWTHAAAQNHSPTPANEAEPKFRQAAHTARSRYPKEIIRNYAGSVATHDAKLPPSSAPGVVVITLVVAARRELADVGNVRDLAELERALDALGAIDPGDFVAMEVVWSPADENDRASVEQIEQRYPELVRLRPP